MRESDDVEGRRPAPPILTEAERSEYAMSDPQKNLMFYALILVTAAVAFLLSAYAFPHSLALAAPSLGGARSFAVLGGSTVTNTGASEIAGDLGVSSPGVSVTGFPPGTIAGGARHVGDAAANEAQRDAQTAYAALARQACKTALAGQDLGGQTLTPAVYCFTSSAPLTGQLVLDARGNSNAVWIFQIASTLTTATGSSVALSRSAQAGNVFWQVGSAATLGTGTAFVGNILAHSSITMNTGASLSGRALARAAVTLDGNTMRVPQ